MKISEKISQVKLALYFSQDKGARIIAACLPAHTNDHAFNELMERFSNLFKTQTIQQQKIAAQTIEYLKEIRLQATNSSEIENLLEETLHEIISKVAIQDIVSETNSVVII